ncbi:MAG: alpha/beta fold hydrolase [Methylobacteriaceae bacterium]|nr:alpha/beta fold hydrolase [Methylobacteriaceae bacterium]
MTPLVLVPGMLCDARLFAPQLAAFAGERDCRVADLTRDDAIEAMARRLLDDAPAGRFALAGLSLGGIVAMEAARLAPQRIERLALLATNHRAATPDFIAARRIQIEAARAGALRRIVVDEMKANYLGEAASADAALRGLVVDMALDAGFEVFERQSLALFGRRDQSDTLAAYAGALLIVAGREDALCPPATHRAMAALAPAAHLVVIEGSGHLVTLEAAPTATGLMAEWLAGAPLEKARAK